MSKEKRYEVYLIRENERPVYVGITARRLLWFAAYCRNWPNEALTIEVLAHTNNFYVGRLMEYAAIHACETGRHAGRAQCGLSEVPHECHLPIRLAYISKP